MFFLSKCIAIICKYQDLMKLCSFVSTAGLKAASINHSVLVKTSEALNHFGYIKPLSCIAYCTDKCCNIGPLDQLIKTFLII